jgi:hypothetical protein
MREEDARLSAKREGRRPLRRNDAHFEIERLPASAHYVKRHPDELHACDHVDDRVLEVGEPRTTRWAWEPRGSPKVCVNDV